MNKITGLIFCIIAFASCSKDKSDNIAFRITEKDLIPEGITFSSTTNSFYLGSIFKTKIIRINAETGEYNDFIPSEFPGMRFLGMIVDDKNNHLWACGNLRKDGNSYSSISKFNLLTGEMVKSYTYTDTVANTYNDLVEDKRGNIFFTDSYGQAVYKIDARSDSVDIFYEGDEIIHPNGITISPDNRYLYIASNDNGIRVLDIEKRVVTGGPDTTNNSKGIDGLKYYRNSLIGIQNDVRQRSDVKIARYFLDDSGSMITHMEIIDQDHPMFDIPTTFVISEDYLYCLANSQLANISSEYTIRSEEALDDIVILKYKLDKK